MGSNQDKRRRSKQRHAEKQRKKRTLEAKREQERQRALKTKRQENLLREAGSEAIGTPALFRSLVLDKKPDMEEGFSLFGLEMHLVWFHSQESRRQGVESETVSALEIHRCYEVPFSATASDYFWMKTGIETKRYRCEASLFEHVELGSQYGNWLRLQQHQGSEPLGGEDFKETRLAFYFVTAFTGRKILRTLEQLMGLKSPVKFKPQALNMVSIILERALTDKLSALQIDRINELFAMLRLLVPRLVNREVRTETERLELLRRLEQLEIQESKAMDKLKPLAQLSISAKTELTKLEKISRSKYRQRQEKLALAKQAEKEANIHCEACERKLAESKAEMTDAHQRVFGPEATQKETLPERQAAFLAASAKLQEASASLASAQIESRKAAARRKSLEREFNWERVLAEKQLDQAKEKLARAAAAEQLVSAKLDILFYQREEILIDLNLR
jgi:hypothetical protein